MDGKNKQNDLKVNVSPKFHGGNNPSGVSTLKGDRKTGKHEAGTNLLRSRLNGN